VSDVKVDHNKLRAREVVHAISIEYPEGDSTAL